jgi:hypothetical protein
MFKQNKFITEPQMLSTGLCWEHLATKRVYNSSRVVTYNKSNHEVPFQHITRVDDKTANDMETAEFVCPTINFVPLQFVPPSHYCIVVTCQK